MGRPEGRPILFAEPARCSIASGTTLGELPPWSQVKRVHTQLTHTSSWAHTDSLYSDRIDTFWEKS